MSKYLDIRQDFWREEFARALPYREYLQSGSEAHRTKWVEIEKHITTTNEQREMIGQFVRKINVLCYGGIWCGDCVRQGPMFQALAELNPKIDLRFAERVDDSQLANELRINGALKVPVLVFLSEDFFELGRFGDRLMTVYRRMARTQIGPSCETGLVAPPQDELAAEMAEWADIFWRMHIILRLAPMLRERYND
jgi:thiol-disulfide isomerase/thioredoxin